MYPAFRKTRLAALAAVVVCLAPGGAGAAALGGLPYASVAISWQGSGAALFGASVIAGRNAVGSLDSRRSGLNREREGLEAELDILAGEIVELKSRSSRGLRAEAELNRRLQRSQELSARIDELARTEEEVTASLISAAGRLAEAYEAEAEAVRAEIEGLTAAGVEADEVKERIANLAAIEAERRAVLDGMARLESDRRATYGRGATVLDTRGHTDDPDELRARADILRDTKDRLVRRLDDMERKARNARRQRALEREMDGFLAESRLFDEGDRAASRLVDSSTEGAPVSGGGLVPTRGAELDESAPENSYEAAPPADGEGGDWDPSAGFDGDRSTGPEFGGEPIDSPSSTGPGVSQLDRITTRAEASAALDSLLSLDGSGSPEEMEAYREEIERLIRRLERRADSLERRAASLESSR